MEKKINKKNIATFAALGVLTTMIGTGIGLHICDSSIDHTQEICPITKMQLALSMYPDHQEKQILRDYISQGVKDAALIHVYYDKDYHDIAFTTEVSQAMKYIREDGTIDYVAPMGGILDGDMVIKETMDIIPVNQLERRENADGGFDFVLPEGYQFKLANGVVQAVKVEEEGCPAFVTYKTSSDYMYAEDYAVLKLKK